MYTPLRNTGYNKAMPTINRRALCMHPREKPFRHRTVWRQLHRTGTSPLHKSNIVTEERWPRGSGALIPNPHSLLNIHYPLSVFQSSLMLILFREGVKTCSRNYEETSPICDDPISRSARRCARSLSPLQKSFPNLRCYMWTEALSSMVFLSTQELSGIVWTKTKNAQLIAVQSPWFTSETVKWQSEGGALYCWQVSGRIEQC